MPWHQTAHLVRVGCFPPWHHTFGLLCKSRHQGTWHAGGLPHRLTCDLFVQGHFYTITHMFCCTFASVGYLALWLVWLLAFTPCLSTALQAWRWTARADGLWPRAPCATCTWT